MTRNAFVSGPRDGRLFRIGQDEIRGALSEDHTGGAVFLGVHELLAGFGGPPLHIHGSMDHVFYVLEGEVRVSVEGEQVAAGAGAAAFVPHGVAHSFGNPAAAPARMIEFNVPGGFDRYYAELESLFPPGSTIDPQKIGEVMARFDTRRA